MESREGEEHQQVPSDDESYGNGDHEDYGDINIGNVEFVDYQALLQEAIGIGIMGLFILAVIMETAREAGQPVPDELTIMPDPETYAGLASLIGLYANVYGLTYPPLTAGAIALHSTRQAINYYQGKTVSPVQVVQGRGVVRGFIRWAGMTMGVALFMAALRAIWQYLRS